MLNKLYSRYGKRTVLIVGAVLVFFVVFVLVQFFGSNDDSAIALEAANPEVTVASVASLLSGSSFTAVGTVEAVSEARLQTEAGGRITAVNVQIGDSVRAGTVLASIENNSERAALLQAQGAYEVALAGAQQGDSGVRAAETALKSAENAALSAVRGSYTAVNNILISSIDQFYSNPQGQVPGVRVSGDTSFLSSERVAFQTIMPKWQTEVADSNVSNVDRHLNEAEANTAKMIGLLDSLILVTSNANNSDTLLGQPLTSFSAGLLADRSTLNGVISNIQNTRSGLVSAKEAVLRASIGGTGGQVSVANAQVKIALGSLRSAQANYEKTLIRTPITGVVNALYLKSGEYVSPGAPAAIIANNNGLEINTSISQDDREGLEVGDVVAIDGLSTGVISAIAGAIDPATGKVAIKVGVDAGSTLENGSTVSIQFSSEADAQVTEIVIPLSSIKMTGTGPVVFTVNAESDALVAVPVVLGTVSGESVVIKEGVTLDSQIVVDARGLKEGELVTVKTK